MGLSKTSGTDITGLLRQWGGGDRDGLARLMPLVYDELHLIASRHMAHEWRAGRLQTTVLVNEAYLKLVGQRQVDWQDRRHFFSIAAQLMRRILVDSARRQQREKHGGDRVQVGLDELPAAALSSSLDAVDALALDQALRKLEALDPTQGRIVELRFFAGMTVTETADVVGFSPATVKREWALAKGWLYRELTRNVEPSST